MGKKNSIKASLFLFVILFSFSVSAYNTLKQSAFFHSGTAVQVDPLNKSLATDNLLFEELEETENDSEELLSESFFLLPFYNFSSLSPVNKRSIPFADQTINTSAPIFISVRSLRI
jgi:hypothetical protein